MRHDDVTHGRQDAEAHQSFDARRCPPQGTERRMSPTSVKRTLSYPRAHAQCALSGTRRHAKSQIPPDNLFKHLDMRLCADAQWCSRDPAQMRHDVKQTRSKG